METRLNEQQLNDIKKLLFSRTQVLPSTKNLNQYKLLVDLAKKYGLIDTKDENGFTPLMHVVDKSKHDFAKILIHAGADVNAKNNQRESFITLLYKKLDRSRYSDKYYDFLKFIFAKKVQLDEHSQSKLQHLLFDKISSYGEKRKKIIRLILPHINPNGTNYRGSAALTEATRKDMYQVVKMLLDAKANPAEGANQVALHQAALNQNHIIFKMLLEAKADPSVKNNDYQTVFEVATGSCLELLQTSMEKNKMPSWFTELCTTGKLPNSTPAETPSLARTSSYSTLSGFESEKKSGPVIKKPSLSVFSTFKSKFSAPNPFTSDTSQQNLMPHRSKDSRETTDITENSELSTQRM